MSAYLRSDAVGIAAMTITYTVLCLIATLTLGFLVWVHHERKSYVAMFAFFMTLSTAASLAQQCHLLVDWKNIKIRQHEVRVDRRGNPELNIAGASFDVDLVLFYIRYYCYIVEGILAACWATELTVSVYQLHPPRPLRRYGSNVAKIAAVLFPIIQLGLLQSSTVQSSVPGFMFLANFTMALSLFVVIVLLFATLTKYISTKRAMMSWHVKYGDASSGSDGVVAPRRTIYDHWLILRFSMAFFVLGSFEFIVIALEIWSAIEDRQVPGPGPDFSWWRARRDFCLFMPGVTPSLLAFATFGTTRVFREYMYSKLVPKRFQKKSDLGYTEFRIQNPSSAPSTATPQRPSLATVAHGSSSGRGSRYARAMAAQNEHGMALHNLDLESGLGRLKESDDELSLYSKTQVTEVVRPKSQETDWDQESATTARAESSSSKK